MKGARRWSAVAWVVAVVAAMAWFANALKVDSDFSAFLPSGRTETQRILTRELRDGRAADG